MKNITKDRIEGHPKSHICLELKVGRGLRVPCRMFCDVIVYYNNKGTYPRIRFFNRFEKEKSYRIVLDIEFKDIRLGKKIITVSQALKKAGIKFHL